MRRRCRVFSGRRWVAIVPVLALIVVFSLLIGSDDSKTTLRTLSEFNDPDTSNSRHKHQGNVIVTLAGGDTSARHLVALLQSLRDVKTEIPIIVLLARGGLGSAACSNQTWKQLMNRSEVRCGDYGTIG